MCACAYLQPANLFITKSGLIKLGDLGCCKLLQSPDEACTNEYGTLRMRCLLMRERADRRRDLRVRAAGSPQYLSPEVWQHGIGSHKSDIWSIGCVAYELLAHVPPFKEPSLLHKVLTSDPCPLPEQYSAGLKELVFRMLRKDPEQRPGSTDLLRDAIVAHHAKRWLAASHTPLGEA